MLTLAVIQAAVLLTANVGLLAIQSVDTAKADRSLAQISSYISTFLNLGNIILCTILARQHRLDAHMTAQAAVGSVNVDAHVRFTISPSSQNTSRGGCVTRAAWNFLLSYSACLARCSFGGKSLQSWCNPV